MAWFKCGSGKEKTLTLVHSGQLSEAKASIAITLTSVKDYGKKTADDFIVEFPKVQLTFPSSMTTNTGAGLTITKSYNASTGVLTITSSGNNNCGATFGYVNGAWTTQYRVYTLV